MIRSRGLFFVDSTGRRRPTSCEIFVSSPRRSQGSGEWRISGSSCSSIRRAGRGIAYIIGMHAQWDDGREEEEWIRS